MVRIMRKFMGGELCAGHSQNSVMGDKAERKDNFEVWQVLYFGVQKRLAGFDFFPCRLVFRRQAPHGICDTAIDKRQAVIRIRFIGSPGQPEFQERVIEKLSRVIAGEGTACKIGSAQAGGQPYNQKLRIFGAERRNGGVELIREFLAVFSTKIRQSRAKGAIWRRSMRHGAQF